MKKVFIASALRTPIGKFLGSLSDLSPADLGVKVVAPALERAGVSPELVGELIFGCGRQAGAGPNVARQILVRSGIPESQTAYTVNMACGSGLLAIIQGAESIRRGDHQVVVVGGTESMSRLPYYLENVRTGSSII